ncbi:hypothetical protein SAMN05216525_10576 [Bradyrhizobium sp. Gha]|nr:hypothetical protein SAMN05216525_10576 [Bradyrhizobium sp. Gha]
MGPEVVVVDDTFEELVGEVIEVSPYSAEYVFLKKS